MRSPTSFDNIKQKWLPEIKHHAAGVPFILVGTKVDLRNNNEWVNRLASEGKSPVATKDGEKLAAELGAAKYIECSALTQENQKRIFDEAITIALAAQEKGKKPAEKKRRGCAML